MTNLTQKLKRASNIPTLKDNVELWILNTGKSFTKALGDKINRSVLRNSINSILFCVFNAGMMGYGFYRLNQKGIEDGLGWGLVFVFSLLMVVSLLMTVFLVIYLKNYHELKKTHLHASSDIISLGNYQGPWRRDHSFSTAHGKAIMQILISFYLGLFVLPFVFIFEYPVIQVAMMIMSIALMGHGIFQLGRSLYFGKTRVTYASFPIHCGSEAEITLELPKKITSFESSIAILRYIEERDEVERTYTARLGHQTHIVTRSYEIETFTDEFKPSPTYGEKKIAFSFKIPPEKPTKLEPVNSTDSAFYWILEVKIQKPGLDFQDFYLLPIFSSF